MSDNPFTANWSAKGHMLCLGHWEISYQGEPLTLPDAVAEDHMNTQGNFSWLFPDDDDYIEGKSLEFWIDDNADWLYDLFEGSEIPFDQQHITWFYQAVNKSDWRCGSCGGCL